MGGEAHLPVVLTVSAACGMVGCCGVDVDARVRTFVLITV